MIDGDTIELANGEKVRFIGVDTPETVHPDRGVEPFGPEASDFTRQLLEGKQVYLIRDISERDRYGRLLRYVYTTDGVFVNLALISSGLARLATYPPDVAHVDEFSRAQEQARLAGAGMWGVPVSEAESPPPSPPPTAAPSASGGAIALEIVSVTSPIRHGRDATLTAHTAPGASCSITVYYMSGPSTAQGLFPKTADSAGNVSWTWRVGSRTTPGSWRIVVTASKDNQTVQQTTYFTVT